MDTGGNPITQKVFSNVYDAGIKQTDSEQQKSIVHEGIHSTVSERLGNGLSPVLGIEPYDSEHQNPYNQAAEKLLDPR